MDASMLTAEQGKRLNPAPPPSPKGGRPRVEDRDALRGILFVLRTGIPWQALPTETFGVSVIGTDGNDGANRTPSHPRPALV